ncbi:MAG: hypothetical protein VW667_03000 [Candidatus Neomarinimicrobiota bacterium]
MESSLIFFDATRIALNAAFAPDSVVIATIPCWMQDLPIDYS